LLDCHPDTIEAGRKNLNNDESAEQAGAVWTNAQGLHTESFFQLREPVRDPLERSLSFFLGAVHQQTLAIGGDVKQYADCGQRRAALRNRALRAEYSIREKVLVRRDSSHNKAAWPWQIDPAHVAETSGLHPLRVFGFAVGGTRIGGD